MERTIRIISRFTKTFIYLLIITASSVFIFNNFQCDYFQKKEFTEKEEVEPDLVVIPSSPFHLSGWGRDLTGRVYLDIERSTGIPVALVECEPIFD